MTDPSVVMATLSVIANANATVAAVAAGGTNNSLSVTRSLISFLRMEADLSEERAKRLRKQAATIAEQFGITEESQQAYGTFVISTHNTILILAVALKKTCPISNNYLFVCVYIDFN
jgi:hypothetical protein